MGLGVLLQAKFYKNRLTGYTHLGKIYTKITNFGDFRACKAHIFKATSVKFGMRLRTRDTLPRAYFCKNS